VAVAVLPLVAAGVVAEVGCRPTRSHRALGDARHCRRVVRARGDGEVGDRSLMG